MKKAVVRSLAAVGVVALAAACAVVAQPGGGSPVGLTPATSSPPSPSGSLVYAASAASPADALQLHTLDLSNGTDTALPGPLTNAGNGFTAVSPDGTKVAVNSEDGRIFGGRIDVYDLAAGTWTPIDGLTDAGFDGPAWMPDSTHLVALKPDVPEDGYTALWIYGLDGSRTMIPGTRLTGTSITSFAVAPSGLQIAFSTRGLTGPDTVSIMNIDGSSVTPLHVTGKVDGWTHDGSRILLSEPLTSADGKPGGSVIRTITPRGGSPTTLPLTYTATTQYGASLSPDDAWLAIESQTVQNVMNATVQVVPVAGGAAPQTVLTSTRSVFGPSYLGAWTATDSTAPAMTPVTVTLGATSAAFSWPLIRTEDVVGVQIALSPGSTVPASYAAGARRVTVLGASRTASVTGLISGATYSYSVWAIDGKGNASTPVTGHLQLVPAPTVAAPAFASTVSGAGVPVRYASAGGGTAAMRLTSDSVFASGVNPFNPGQPVPGTSGTFTFTPTVYLLEGAVVGYRAGAVDAYGNVRWSAPAAGTVVPYDDRNTNLGLLGPWTRPSTTGAWLGTTSVTGTGGSVTLRSGQGPKGSTCRFTVVATVSPTGGKVKAYVDGRYVTTFSTRGALALRRNVWSSALLGSGAHRITLIQVSGSGWFRFDGLGVDRR